MSDITPMGQDSPDSLVIGARDDGLPIGAEDKARNRPLMALDRKGRDGDSHETWNCVGWKRKGNEE